MKYSYLAASIRRWRSAGESRRSGSTSRSKRAKNASLSPPPSSSRRGHEWRGACTRRREHEGSGGRASGRRLGRSVRSPLDAELTPPTPVGSPGRSEVTARNPVRRVPALVIRGTGDGKRARRSADVARPRGCDVADRPTGGGGVTAGRVDDPAGEPGVAPDRGIFDDRSGCGDDPTTAPGRRRLSQPSPLRSDHVNRLLNPSEDSRESPLGTAGGNHRQGSTNMLVLSALESIRLASDTLGDPRRLSLYPQEAQWNSEA